MHRSDHAGFVFEFWAGVCTGMQSSPDCECPFNPNWRNPAMRLTDEMKDMVEHLRLCYVATVTPDGKPNLVPQRIAESMGR